MPHLEATRLYGDEVLRLRRVTCDGHDGRRIAEERNDGARIIVVLRGRFAFRDRHVRAVASPASSLFLRDGQTYEIAHVDDEGDVCVTVQGAVADALIERGSTARPLSTPAYLEVHSIAARLVRGETVAGLALEETLCAALGSDVGVMRAAARQDQAIADAIGHAVERDFHAALRLSDLAEAAGVSVFHACRAFRRATGTTIRRYHEETRLRHALAWLVDTDVSLARLAVELGFANQPHFTTRFRRRFQATPQAVRQGYRRPRVGGFFSSLY